MIAILRNLIVFFRIWKSLARFRVSMGFRDVIQLSNLDKIEEL